MKSMTFQKYFDQVAISPNKLKYRVFREDIFADLAATQRRILPAEGAAEKGDFVCCRVSCGDTEQELSFCIGNKADPDLDGVLEGRCAGEQFSVNYCGEPAAITVLSVKHPISFDAEKDDFADLHIEGVANSEDYIALYLERNRDFFRRQRTGELLQSVVMQYRNLALRDATSPKLQAGKLEEYASHCIEDNREMLLSFTGGDQAAYEKIMEDNFHKGSIEANEAAYREADLDTYRLGVLAEPVMEEEGFYVTDEQYDTHVKQMATNMRLTEERFRQLCVFDDFKHQVFVQRLQNMLGQELMDRIEVIVE